MVRTLLFVVLGLLFIVRLDVWWWNDPTRVLGLPIGLAFHLGVCLAAALLMWLITRYAWPAELEEEVGDG